MTATFPAKFLQFLATSCPVSSIRTLRNWTCSRLKQPTISQTFLCSFDKVHARIICRLWEGFKVTDMYFRE